MIHKIDVAHTYRQVLVVSDGNRTGNTIPVTDLDGEIPAEHTSWQGCP